MLRPSRRRSHNQLPVDPGQAQAVAVATGSRNYSVSGPSSVGLKHGYRDLPHLADDATKTRAALGVLIEARRLLVERGWSPIYAATKRCSLTAALQQTGEIEDEWARAVLRRFISGISIPAWERRPERESRDVLRALDRSIEACGGEPRASRGGWRISASPPVRRNFPAAGGK